MAQGAFRGRAVRRQFGDSLPLFALTLTSSESRHFHPLGWAPPSAHPVLSWMFPAFPGLSASAVNRFPQATRTTLSRAGLPHLDSEDDM